MDWHQFGTWVINVKAISKPLVCYTWYFIFVWKKDALSADANYRLRKLNLF